MMSTNLTKTRNRGYGGGRFALGKRHTVTVANSFYKSKALIVRPNPQLSLAKVRNATTVAGAFGKFHQSKALIVRAKVPLSLIVKPQNQLGASDKSLRQECVSNREASSSSADNKQAPVSLLHPGFLTGFVDGEGCFYINICKNSLLKVGFTVKAIFQLTLHKKDRPLLESIRAQLGGVGNITKLGKDLVQYRVSSTKDLKVIIDHFDKYPLLTKKRADFELFKQIVEMLTWKEHLTPEGLQKIVNLRASMNLGLSDALKAAFPNTIPVSRPLVVDQEIQDPNWLAGFTSAEGCFFVTITKSTTNKSGFKVQLRFQITQHIRDTEIIRSLIECLDCGGYYFHSADLKAGNFIVTRFSDITDKIIPFFEKYPVEGVKALNYADFKRVVELMKVKAHLTADGLEEIRQIKAGMNTGRS